MQSTWRSSYVVWERVKFPKLQIIDSSKVKELPDNNFKFDENGSKFSKLVENT